MIQYFKSLAHRFERSEEGATSVEYAVMLMLIAGICISVIQALGGSIEFLWDDTVNDLNDAYDAHEN